MHINKAIKLGASTTAIISLPLLASAVGRVPGRAQLVPSILELSSAASYNLAIPARQEGTILPAVQTSVIIGLLFELPVCTADPHVFTRLQSPPQKHALQRGNARQCKSWMSTPIMPSRQCKSSASNTIDCVLNDCLCFMSHHLGGIQSVIVLGNSQLVCLYRFPIRSIAVCVTICKGKHRIQSQHVQCKLHCTCAAAILVYKKCWADNRMQCSSLDGWQCLLCPSSPRILGWLF